MIFDEVERILRNTNTGDLPGEESQFKMLPSIRPRISWDKILETKPTLAAVMLLLYPDGDKTMFSLILRNTYNGAHSAQIGLPGGKLELGESELEAAIRETYEEIGVRVDQERIHFPLTKVWVAPSKFLVTPFVATLNEKPKFNIDEFEVNKLIEVNVDDLLNEEIFVETKVESKYVKDLKVNAFMLENQVVWGATAMMLSEFKDILKRELI